MTILSLLKSYKDRRDGSVMIGLGLTFSVVAGATVASIEIAQMQTTRQIVQDKLDATIIYLASKGADDVNAAGTAYFDNIVNQNDMNITDMVRTFVTDPETGTITGTAEFSIKSLMIGGLIKEKKLNVKAVASPQSKGDVEIALVLDVSGSMADPFYDSTGAAATSTQTRMGALIEATNALLDTLESNSEQQPSISVIPYASSVDITDLFAGQSDSERLQKFTSLYFDSLQQTQMMDGTSIMDIDETNTTYQDRSHTIGVYPAERFTSQNGDSTYNISLAAPSSSNPLRVYTEHNSKFMTDFSYLGTYGSEKVKVRPYWYYDDVIMHTDWVYAYTSWWGQQYYYRYDWVRDAEVRPTVGVLPMTQNVQSVRDYITRFTPNGGTAAHVGTAWGLYALSPEWTDIFGTTIDVKPFEETTEKYLVIMTDGQFNSQRDGDMSNSELYSYFQSVCTTARNNGVRVFTVGLLLDADSESALKECSGNSGGFYSAQTRLQLVEAFQSVGRKTSNLRLSY